MEPFNPAPYIDHTLLKADATTGEIRRLCEEAVEFAFAAVCVPPVFVPTAAELLYGSDVGLATVIGFPLGYQTAGAKAFEAAEAVARGATELDMVIHLGAAREGRLEDIAEEIGLVVRAASGAAVKVILECCALEDPLKEALTEIAAGAGAAFVKTSTGFGTGGATIGDVRILSRVSAGRIGVKAAGGIRDLTFFRELLSAGATRIGTSSGVKIVDQWRQDFGA